MGWKLVLENKGSKGSQRRRTEKLEGRMRTGRIERNSFPEYLLYAKAHSSVTSLIFPFTNKETGVKFTQLVYSGARIQIQLCLKAKPEL